MLQKRSGMVQCAQATFKGSKVQIVQSMLVFEKMVDTTRTQGKLDFYGVLRHKFKKADGFKYR